MRELKLRSYQMRDQAHFKKLTNQSRLNYFIKKVKIKKKIDRNSYDQKLYLSIYFLFETIPSFCGFHIQVRTIGTFRNTSFRSCQCQFSNNVIGKSFFCAEPNVQ